MLPRSRTEEVTKINKAVPPRWLYLTSLPILIGFFAYMLINSYILSCKWLATTTYNGFPLGLTGGWIGKHIDLGDLQWKAFRSNIPLMASFGALYLLLGHAVKKHFCVQSRRPLMYYYFTMSMIFAFVLFQLTLIFPIIIALINYYIAKKLGHTKLGVFLAWTFNPLMLFSSKYFYGFQFWQLFGFDYLWLDQYRGLVSWETYFNIMFCKLISFTFDYRNSVLQQETKPKQDWDEYRKRTCTRLDPKHEFDIVSYFMYLFYIPLLIAGPVSSYNAFYSYVMKEPQKESSTKKTLRYLSRVLLYGILLDVSLHFIFPNGFNDKGMWKRDGPFQNGRIVSEKYTFTSAEVASTGALTVVYMYVKFYVIWRFFRAWALLDGVNPPENLKRCVVNTNSISGFWRSWHASLNLWIVKYIYVPMGGSKRKFISMWFIFIFIALWHEFSTLWMAWAFMNCVVFMIEMVGTHVIAALPPIRYIKRISDNKYRPYYNLLAAAGSSIILPLGVLSQLAIMYGFHDSYIFLSRAYGESPFMIVVTFVFMFVVAECSLWAQNLDTETRSDH